MLALDRSRSSVNLFFLSFIENGVERISLSFYAICLTLIDHECIILLHTEVLKFSSLGRTYLFILYVDPLF
ncbi:hypothetical protein NCCP133_19220 [Cytobacillus sp. NCCP-133]|nr:hypothetical protein NCCP133_19220 [Cytobacillus sp. NCCP-133]